MIDSRGGIDRVTGDPDKLAKSDSGIPPRSLQVFTRYPEAGALPNISAMPGRASQTGEESPESGISSVIHQNHQLPSVVILLKGETFPLCTECLPPVSFQSVRAAPYVSGRAAINSTYSNVLDSRANSMKAVNLHPWKSA